MEKINLQSIRTKLLFIILGTAFISLMITGLINHINSSNAISEKISENLLLNAEVAAEGIAKEVDAVKSVVETCAMDEKIKSMKIADAIPRMIEIKKMQPKLDLLFLVELNGDYYPDSGKNGSLRDREYFKDAIARKKTTVSGDPVISKANNKLVLPMLVPIHDASGILKGFLGGTVDIENIKNYVLNRRIGRNGYTYAVGKSGTFFIHPNEQNVLKVNLLTDKNISPDLSEMTRIALDGRKIVKEYTFDGIAKYAGCVPVPGTSWITATTFPKNEAIESVTNTMVKSIIVGITVLLVSGFAAFFFSSKISRPIVALQRFSEKMAGGDLSSVKIDASLSKDEVGRLAESFNTMNNNLRQLVVEVIEVASKMSSASNSFADTADVFSKNSQAQAASTEEVTATIEEVTGGVENIAQEINIQFEKINSLQTQINGLNSDIGEMSSQVSNATHLAAEINNLTNSSEMSLKSMSDNMEKISASSQEMKNIINIINEISDRINLLSLNAAIEAARAGEAGRGFAVVADEISNLADQTASSIKEIGSRIIANEAEIMKFSSNVEEVLSLLKSVIKGIGSIASVTNSVTTTMRLGLDNNMKVNEDFTNLKKLAENIKLATTEQKTAMDEMVKSVGEITYVAQQSAASSEAISSNANELSAAAKILKTKMDFFKV